MFGFAGVCWLVVLFTGCDCCLWFLDCFCDLCCVVCLGDWLFSLRFCLLCCWLVCLGLGAYSLFLGVFGGCLFTLYNVNFGWFVYLVLFVIWLLSCVVVEFGYIVCVCGWFWFIWIVLVL